MTKKATNPAQASQGDYDERAKANRARYAQMLESGWLISDAHAMQQCQTFELRRQHARLMESADEAYQALDFLVKPILHNRMTPAVRLWLVERLERMQPEALWEFMFGTRSASRPRSAELRRALAAIYFRMWTDGGVSEPEAWVKTYDEYYGPGSYEADMASKRDSRAAHATKAAQRMKDLKQIIRAELRGEDRRKK